MKRIICFISAFFSCAVLLCSAVSASNNYDGGNAVYTIAYNRTLGSEEFGSTDITVYQYVTDYPISVNGTEGWLRQYFGNNFTPETLPSSGFRRVVLFNGTWFQFSFSQNNYSCYYCFYNFDGEVVSVPIVTQIAKTRDFFLYVDYNGNFEICIFLRPSLEILDVPDIPFNPNLSGVIFPYNQVPGGDGTDSSYEQGYNKGYDDGAKLTYSDAYNLGFRRGQDSEKIVGNALWGFFSGLEGFVSPFLSIGVGSFTLGNLLGIIVTTFIVMIIVKIVRGD